METPLGKGILSSGSNSKSTFLSLSEWDDRDDRTPNQDITCDVTHNTYRDLNTTPCGTVADQRETMS